MTDTRQNQTSARGDSTGEQFDDQQVDQIVNKVVERLQQNPEMLQGIVNR
jgi:parvulin-like peptidyl-prolyl isomerase